MLSIIACSLHDGKREKHAELLSAWLLPRWLLGSVRDTALLLRRGWQARQGSVFLHPCTLRFVSAIIRGLIPLARVPCVRTILTARSSASDRYLLRRPHQRLSQAKALPWSSISGGTSHGPGSNPHLARDTYNSNVAGLFSQVRSRVAHTRP